METNYTPKSLWWQCPHKHPQDLQLDYFHEITLQQSMLVLEKEFSSPKNSASSPHPNIFYPY